MTTKPTNPRSTPGQLARVDRHIADLRKELADPDLMHREQVLYEAQLEELMRWRKWLQE